MRKFLLTSFVLAFAFYGYGQILTPVKWSYASKKLSNSIAVLMIKADIDKGWHIYSQHINSPIKTVFKFKTDKSYLLMGGTAEPVSITKYEVLLQSSIKYFERSVIFQQKIKLKKAFTNVDGSVSFLVCGQQTLSAAESVKFTIPVK
jgi:hypothetical protein